MERRETNPIGKRVKVEILGKIQSPSWKVDFLLQPPPVGYTRAGLCKLFTCSLTPLQPLLTLLVLA